MNDEIMTTVGCDIYSFDGRVLEIFGIFPARFHIRHLYVRVTGPDRKGKRTVEIGHGQVRGGGTIRTYTAAEWEQAHGLPALLEAVQKAIDSASGHGPV
ncbi:hypothetical protein R6V09_30895 [Streptomyces sp. W16]|uniref:hypothetical protein n=1 Tax=Streptomyces sp. W16 TaxID=3076631 RepID=UPI00295AAAD9|nr:hypothetical protein [Streptomyces sp. W16]MDV9174503.1 hypothetical protein [Streptomyces sp. W16]